MNKFYIPLLILLALAGCKPIEKTTTVPEFLHDTDLLDKTRAFCKENPGERSSLPNCVNSQEASTRKNKIRSFGTDCYKNGVTDHACVDQYISKYLSK